MYLYVLSVSPDGVYALEERPCLASNLNMSLSEEFIDHGRVQVRSDLNRKEMRPGVQAISNGRKPDPTRDECSSYLDDFVSLNSDVPRISERGSQGLYCIRLRPMTANWTCC